MPRLWLAMTVMMLTRLATITTNHQTPTTPPSFAWLSCSPAPLQTILTIRTLNNLNNYKQLPQAALAAVPQIAAAIVLQIL